MEDHPVFRHCLVALLDSEPGLTVCGCAGDAATAVKLIERTEPDLVLVDFNLPGRNGLELLKDIVARRSDQAVIMLSMHDEAIYADRALRAGARKYVSKSEGGEKLLESIHRVLAAAA